MARSRGKSWLLTLFLVILVATLGVFLWSAYRGFQHRSASADSQPLISREEAGKIRVEVLNGSGKEGAGMEVAQYLREKGFDVVGIGNAEAQDFEKTIVVDRMDDRLSKAQPVARVLHVAAGETVPLKNPDLLLEVSVYVGKDYDKKIQKKGGAL